VLFNEPDLNFRAGYTLLNDLSMLLHAAIEEKNLGGAKSGGKILDQRKTLAHKKIQSPLSDWIF